MAGLKRIREVYSFYVNQEPCNEIYSINRFEVLRERFGRILKAKKLRSVQIAMGSNALPIQDIIYRMTSDDFEDFIDEHITGKRRKEIYKKYS